MYITIAEVARSLGVSPTHIAYWARTNRIPTPKKIGASRVFTEAQAKHVKEWYAQHLQQRSK